MGGGLLGVNNVCKRKGCLAWRIPGTGEPDGLPSMGSHRVRHNRSDLAAISNTLCYYVIFLIYF